VLEQLRLTAALGVFDQ